MKKGVSGILAICAAVIAVAGALIWRLVSFLAPRTAAGMRAASGPGPAPAALPAVSFAPPAPSYSGSARIPVALKAPPRCFARSPSGDIWVCGGREMVKITASGAEAARIALDGEATAISVDPQGRMFLAMGNRLEVRDGDGQVTRTFADLDRNALIVSIAADPKTSDLFLADAGNKVIRHYTKEGRLLGFIGERGAGFVVPSPYFSISVSGDGRLYAANPGRHGIETYGYDGSLLASFYSPGPGIDGFAGCCNPACIFVVEDGILTVEKGVTRVKVVTPDGKLVRVIADGEALDPSFFGNPAVVDAEGRVLVLDRVAGEIRVFARG